MQITQQFDGGNIVARQAAIPMRSVWKFGQTTLLSFINGSISGSAAPKTRAVRSGF